MARLFIMREKSVSGMSGVMNCYVNNQFICRLKNGEDASCQVESGIVEFKCNIPNSPMSDPVFLDLTNKNIVTISVKQGSWKPVIRVHDPSIVVDRVFTNVRSCATTFKPTKTVEKYLAIDENTRQWALYKGLIPSWKNDIPRRYEDIVDYELLEDGSTITKGGLGSAVVGGILFGHTGAIVGSITGKKKTKQTCTNLTIKITVNDIACPTEYIRLITSSTKRESTAYKKAYQIAQDILSLLQVICVQQEVPQPEAPAPSTAASPIDELRKFKQLMDEGILSEEEFLAKKRQLLGL